MTRCSPGRSGSESCCPTVTLVLFLLLRLKSSEKQVNAGGDACGVA